MKQDRLAQAPVYTRVASRRPARLLLLLLAMLAAPFLAYGATVTVPIELDYGSLRQLLIRQLFDTPDQSTEILNDPSGCSRIVLSNPQLAARPPNLEIVTDARVRLGVGALGRCTTLLQWQGSAGFLGRPVIQPGATSVRIEPVDSWLVATNGKKITSGRIWELAQDRFHPLFRRFSLDLAPSIEALGGMLPDVLPHRSSQQLQAIVGSLKLAEIQVSPDTLDVSIGFQVEELAQPPRPEAVLSARELQQWEARWQMMDALFTFAVKYYASATQFQGLRSTLLEILIDSRYRLRDALTQPVSPADDPVRHWFVDSWRRLSPVIRRIGLAEGTVQQPLLWISLLTATDALYALDQLGPAIGLDISSDGLRRLIRLIDRQADGDPLRYDQAVDPELQRLFRLPSTLAPEQPSGFHIDLWPIQSAWAGSATDRLDRWAPGRDQLDQYLPLVARLLEEIARDTAAETKLEPAVTRLFRNMVLATAWQESCWRQYIVTGDKIKPLRSTTGDVGMMQINEKVWRGFYDIQKLRWDVAYNSRAGAEVLQSYLVRYALKQGEHKRSGGLDNLARASYSAYNGGPSQVTRYRKPNVASTHKKVDAAFWKKYQQVKAGNALNVARCLGGETKLSTKTASATKPVKRKAAGGRNKSAEGASGSTGERWVRARNKKHFTLQLAVFSRQDSARKYITLQSLSGPVHIYPLGQGKATQFAVIYGSYAKRKDAERARQRLQQLKPWIRQFGELQKAGRS